MTRRRFTEPVRPARANAEIVAFLCLVAVVVVVVWLLAG